MVCFFYILPTYRQNKNKNKTKDLDPKFIFAKTKKQLGRILCGTFDFILNINEHRTP
jgi:hypothetical protein